VDLNVVIGYVLLDVAVVVAAARLAGRLFRKIGQPAVLGEIAAGIALGPTLLGLLPGHLDTALFPVPVRGYLTVVAQLGLVLFMFIVGLEVDLSLIRGRERAAGMIAAASMVLPFGLGAGVAVLLYPLHDTVAGRSVSPVAFVVFIGVAMSITAMPVLARILSERRMQRTPLGVLAMACAVIDDVLGWSLLAVVIAVAAGGDLAGVGRILGLTAVFAVAAFLVARPLLARLVPWHRRVGALTPDMLAAILVGLLLSAIVTDRIGVHTILGAFVFGVVMPRRGAAGLTREILERLEQVSLLLLLPVFFVVAGLQVDVSSVGLAGLWQLGLILLAAVAGKFLGALAAARALGMPRRQSTALGVLMNTRGLTEIVILQVGVQLRLLDASMYTLMVTMALVTTAMTGPALRRVYPDRVLNRELAAADRAEAGEVAAYTVLVAVPSWGADAGNGDLAARLGELARHITGREAPARVVLCRLLPAPVQLEVASGVGSDLALVASTGARLREIARGVECDRVRCSVLVRFAADPVAELAALAETIEADVVLTGTDPAGRLDADPAGPLGPDSTGSPGGAGAPAVPAGVTVVRARLGTGGSTGRRVIAVLDGGAGGRAALRIGAQLALARGGTLVVDHGPGRRAVRQADAAVESLRGRGLPAEAADHADHTDHTDHAADVLVAPHAAASTVEGAGLAEHTTVCQVQPDEADRDDELDQAIARITVEPVEEPVEPVGPELGQRQS
jgi:Kef-type K+ transport system membrane component KefB